MSKTKKIILSIGLTSLFSFSLISNSIACEGQTTYSCGTEDMLNMQDQFDANCCAGSSITIIDVCNGGFTRSYKTNSPTDGPNSSCAAN